MQTVLYKYLALYKKLDLPGIGHFIIEETPASLQFAAKQLQPPASRISFVPVTHPTNNHFYTFLSREWGVDKVIAIRRYKEEVEGMAEELKNRGTCELNGIGTLHKTKDGSLSFLADEPSFSLFSVLPADRVLRKHTQHTVLVGEQEHIKTYSLETNNEIVDEEEAKDKWQLYALILAIVAVLMIVLYYATK